LRGGDPDTKALLLMQEGFRVCREELVTGYVERGPGAATVHRAVDGVVRFLSLAVGPVGSSIKRVASSISANLLRVTSAPLPIPDRMGKEEGKRKKERLIYQ
jgi:hypothetical protein